MCFQHNREGAGEEEDSTEPFMVNAIIFFKTLAKKKKKKTVNEIRCDFCLNTSQHCSAVSLK